MKTQSSEVLTNVALRRVWPLRSQRVVFVSSLVVIFVATFLQTSGNSIALGDEVEEDELIYDAEEFDNLMLKYKSIEETRADLTRVLSKEMDRIALACSLSEAQKKKLLLAGRGDIEWYFDYVAEIRSRYVNRVLTQAEYLQLLQDTSSRRFFMSIEVFGASSILRKTLRRTLTEPQLARYQRLERERHLSLIEGLVRTLERKDREHNSIAPRERQRLVELLAEKTDIPSQPASNVGNSFLMLGNTRRFDVEEIRPFLDPHQWFLFHQQMRTADRFERSLQNLGEWPLRSSNENANEKTESSTIVK